jgi:hypothetical protein
MYRTLQYIPQGLKPGILRLFCGTAEAVPFQNKSLLDFHVCAIALMQSFCRCDGGVQSHTLEGSAESCV